MKRKLTTVAAALAVVFPMSAVALGLGDIHLHSSLNEPLKADIELLSVKPGEVADIKVALAGSADFDRAGVDRAFWLSQLRFKVVEQGAGKATIKITTFQPVREPFMNFLIELDWAKGRLLREYTLLLDPPVYSAAVAARVQQPVAAPAPKPAPQIRMETAQQAPAPPKAPPQPVAPGQAVEASPRPVSPSAPEEPAMVMAEPKAVAEPAPPMTAREVKPLSSASKSEPEPEAAEPFSKAAVAKRPVPSVARDPSKPLMRPYSYGPTAPSDTLWSIANRARPDAVTNNQMMLALFRANPGAFATENLNSLKVGSVLRIPKQVAIEAAGRADALAEVKRQHALWEEYRGQVVATAEEAPTGAVADDAFFEDLDEALSGDEEEVAEGSSQALTDDARLKLVSAGAGEAALGGVSGGQADVAALRTELAVVMEDLDSKRQENEELSSRLQETEGLIADMQRLIQLKDDELAALQSRLAGVEAAQDAMGREAASGPAPEMQEAAQTMDVAAPMEAQPEPMPEVQEPAPVPEPMAALQEPTPAPQPVAPVKEPTPRPKPVLPPPPAAEPESFLDSMMGSLPVDPMMAGGGIGAAVLLTVAGVMLARRRRMAPAAGVPAVADDFLEDEAPALDGWPQEGQPPEPEEVQAVARDADGAMAGADQTMIAGPGEVSLEPAEEEDPLAEVNVYLAYERFDQAEELVRTAIQEHPDRHDCKLKLLEVHHAAKNVEGFRTDAPDLRDAVGEDSPLMEQAVAWWKELAPDSDLFVTADLLDDEFADTVASLRDDDKASVEAARAAAMSDSSPAEPDTSSGDVDFDLGLTTPAGLKGEDWEPPTDTSEVDFVLEAADAEQPSEASENLDFELPAGIGGEDGAAATGDNVIDFDLGLQETAQEEVPAQSETGQEGGLENVASGGEDMSLDFDLSLGEEAAFAASEDSESVGQDGDERVTDGLAFDLDLGAEASVEEPESMPVVEEHSQTMDLPVLETEEVSDLDEAKAAADAFSQTGRLDLELEAEVEEAEVPSEEVAALGVEMETARLDDVVSALDVDLVLDDEEQNDLGLGAEVTEPLGADTEVDLDLGDVSGEIDEVGTKLDLAQAYVDMGDTDGARGILGEVMSEGSDTQKEEAEALLAKLA